MRIMFRTIVVSLMTGYLALPHLKAQEHGPLNVFLLRGIGREAGHWGRTYPDLLKYHFPNAQIKLMDLPGAGKYHAQPALPTVEKMADFLRHEYLPQIDSLPGKKVIVATSLAGNVALEWITTYPHDFDGAILLSTSLKGICKSKYRVKPSAKRQFVSIFLTKDIAEREKAFLSINSNLNTENDSLLIAWQGIQGLRPVSQGALLKQTVAGMIYRPGKNERQTPILLIGSKADKIVDESCFHKVAAAINSDLILHETAGHGIPIDVPHWLADTTSYWIEEEVMPRERPAATKHIVTRNKENGVLPMPWLDRGINSTLDNTGKAFTESWHWMDDGINWIGKFMKEVDVNTPDQKQQLKVLRKKARSERKQMKQATGG